MKHLLLSLFLLSSLCLYGQKKEKPVYFLKLQGALLYDVHPKNDYLGINLINLGRAKYYDGILRGLDLEFIRYNSGGQEKVEDYTKWSKERTSFELEYYRSYPIIGGIENGFFIGPSASLLYSQSTFMPNNSTRKRTDEICECLGLGAKLDFFRKISKSVYLDIGTRFTLLDLGFQITQGYDPTLPKKSQRTKDFSADFLRSQFQLMVGVNFKL
ncbi:MAG: hypothetical protein GC192_17370 [Bacteroidetes bacterium]|nr:hypothetical protein [Bacteroidota bacterium]